MTDQREDQLEKLTAKSSSLKWFWVRQDRAHPEQTFRIYREKIAMERKGSTAVVTAASVSAALKKTRTLTTEEEKALRIRFGVGEDPRAPLPRAAGNNAELADELTLIELQLFKAMQARALLARSSAPTESPQKNKIVRALRKKK